MSNLIEFPVSDKQSVGRGLGSGGGSDNDGGMEARITHLETDVSEIKSDVKAMRSDIAYMKGRLDAMPTTLQIIGFAVAVFVAAGVTRLFQ